MNIFIWGLAIFIFFSDQLSKSLISRALNPNETVEVVKNIFFLTLVHNTGAAFGVFKSQTALFSCISILAIVVIVIYLRKRTHTYFLRESGLALVLGGAFGNLIDRLRFGYVIDFLDFKIWPVFNIADSAITVGAFLLIISMLIPKSK